jgi:hypothetical protein
MKRVLLIVFILSVIMESYGQKPTTVSDLWITNTPVRNDTLSQILVRDPGTNGKIRYRMANTIGNFWPLAGSAVFTNDVSIDAEGNDLNISDAETISLNSDNVFTLSSTSASIILNAPGVRIQQEPERNDTLSAFLVYDPQFGNIKLRRHGTLHLDTAQVADTTILYSCNVYLPNDGDEVEFKAFGSYSGAKNVNFDVTFGNDGITTQIYFNSPESDWYVTGTIIRINSSTAKIAYTFTGTGDSGLGISRTSFAKYLKVSEDMTVPVPFTIGFSNSGSGVSEGDLIGEYFKVSKE